MTTRLAPIFANERTAAQLLDMRPSEFLALVEAGHLPRAKDIAGFKRWDVRELHRIISGDCIDGMRNVEW